MNAFTLSGTELSGADLSGTDLSGTVLSGIEASGTKRFPRFIAAAVITLLAAALLTFSVSAKYVLDDLDKPRGWSGAWDRETEIVHSGSGALRLDSTDTGTSGYLCLAQKVISPVDLSEYADGYIRFYLYVTDENVLGDGSQFELTSSGTCDVEELTCSINTYDLHTGWNELIYSVAELSGSVRLDAVNFIRLYMFQTGQQTLILDDIELGSAAEFGIGEVAVRDKSVLTLDNCDSAAGYTDGNGNTPAVYSELRIEGIGAVGSSTESGSVILTKTFADKFDISDYVKSGYIYFWLYVKDSSALTGSSSFALRSSDKDMVAWSVTGLVDGWNEMFLELSDTNIGSGAIDFTSLTSFTLTISGNGANTVAIDRMLYGYSRDFGIKNDDDPDISSGTTKTDTPVKATSANETAYKIILTAAVIVIVCAVLPVVTGAVKTKREKE